MFPRTVFQRKFFQISLHFSEDLLGFRKPAIRISLKNLPQIKTRLQEIGYDAALFSDSVDLWTGAGKVAMVAHSRLPKDLRTAAVVIHDGGLEAEIDFAKVRATGAAVAIGISGERWQIHRIGRDGPHELGHGGLEKLEGFLRERATGLNPDAIYRAKAWGRIDPAARQLDFVDAGLMPLVERDMGERLSGLLEECVRDLSRDLGWGRLAATRADERKAEWLIQAPFWLLAAKTLRDKRVPSFRRVELGDFDDVFARLAKHYRSDDSQAIQVPKVRQAALSRVAGRIDSFASLELLSAEALGHVYESALINKASRKKLGTHSTPPWLIDYILGKLRPWIAEMPPERRFVFEPACGHAGFLVAALRLLDELRPDGFPEARNSYLRKRLRGIDVDPFSQEVARLALTLADVPNPNGWHLQTGDMFTSDIIERESAAADIVLLNPPFEGFGADHRKGWLKNKAAETLDRIVRNLPPGGVLGFLGPQGILQSKQARDLRRVLLRDFEISEVVLFADKVFEFGQPESAVMVARKRDKRPGKPAGITFTRVREEGVSRFAAIQQSDLMETGNVIELLADDNCPIFLPQCSEVWNYLCNNGFPELGSIAAMGQGLFHKGSGEFHREAAEPFPGSRPGFAGWERNQFTHAVPKTTHINVGPDAIDREIMGLDDNPHVILNYAPVSRGSWRLKALIDGRGHPVTSRFIVMRPTESKYSLFVVWALLNSPLANAFTFCHLSKRDNLVGTMRLLPVPDHAKENFHELEQAARNYLNAARQWSAAKAEAASEEALPLFKNPAKKKPSTSAPTEEELYILHLRVDAEVMWLYNLPPAMERRILNLFEGRQRKGVPFEQIGYFPPGFEGLDTVAELVTVLADWEPLAARKSELIRLKVERKASDDELNELTKLKRLSSARRELLAPLPIEEARRNYEELLRRTGSASAD